LDTATLVIVHHVLSLGNVREAARVLGRPVATVSGALSRVQTHLAIPLTTKAGSRLMPTLEGRRINHELKSAAELVGQLAEFSQKTAASMPALSLLALSRFTVIGHTGSIRAAANELGMGQPQLTRQINALEKQLGAVLLERSASGVSFTETGASVLAVACRLCDLWRHMSEQSDERFRQTGRRIRLGAVTPLGWESRIAVDLAALAAEWPRLHPRSALYISSSSADELLAGLDRHQHDLVLLDTEEIPEPLAHSIISRSPLALVGSSHILNSCDGDIGKLLLTAPLALPSLKSGLRQRFTLLVDELLTPDERAGLAVVEIDSIPVIANLVVDHGYLSLLPRSAILGMEAHVASLPLPARYDMPLVLAWKKDPSLDGLASTIGQILGRNDTGPKHSASAGTAARDDDQRFTQATRLTNRRT
jgi:LysR family nitrogen assimilation transcriptional regulator